MHLANIVAHTIRNNHHHGSPRQCSYDRDTMPDAKTFPEASKSIFRRAESLEDSVESIIVFVRVRNVSIQPAVEPLDNG
jgi:hypothetical protein